MQRRMALRNLLGTSIGWLVNHRVAHTKDPGTERIGAPPAVPADGHHDVVADDDGVGTVPVATSGGGQVSGTHIGYDTFSGVHSVKDYGAVGDGVADDTIAIQTAINEQYLSQTDGGGAGAVYLPPGRYRITRSLILAGSGAFALQGAGISSRLVNQAPAGNPTLLLTSKQYFQLDNFAILGMTGFPNDAVHLVDSGFGSVRRLFMCPNGNGLYFTGNTNTFLVDDCQYWPSGYNAGASRDSLATTKHAIWAAGISCNDLHIRKLNAVGYTTVTNGGSCIKFSCSSNAGNVTIADCELEGVPPASEHRAFELYRVFGFTIRDCFIENSVSTFLFCRGGRLQQLSMGSDASLTFGDGTEANACGQIVVADCGPDAVTISPHCFHIVLINCVCKTYTAAPGTTSYFLAGEIAGKDAVDRGFPQGLCERDRPKALGEWVTPAFNPTIFSTESGTWAVVDATHITAWTYTLIGKTMHLVFGFDATTLTGGPSAYLSVTLPDGYVSNARVECPVRAFNNTSSAATVGVATVLAGSAALRIYSGVAIPSPWLSSARMLSAFGAITFEIQ